VLATDRSAHRQSADSFISQVRVKRGFVAPLHLVSGLLAECEDDWGPVIEDYGRQVAQPLPAIPGADGPQRFASRDGELRLQRLQTFLFDCWLLWGPSIPICTCEAWYAGRPVLQFGFGDENNSLALLFEDPIPVEQLRRFFSGEHVRGTALAVKTTNVVGHVQWGPSIDSHEIAEAQQSGVRAPDEERAGVAGQESPHLWRRRQRGIQCTVLLGLSLGDVRHRQDRFPAALRRGALARDTPVLRAWQHRGGAVARHRQAAIGRQDAHHRAIAAR
jgi:hypothetical protein